MVRIIIISLIPFFIFKPKFTNHSLELPVFRTCWWKTGQTKNNTISRTHCFHLAPHSCRWHRQPIQLKILADGSTGNIGTRTGKSSPLLQPDRASGISQIRWLFDVSSQPAWSNFVQDFIVIRRHVVFEFQIGSEVFLGGFSWILTASLPQYYLTPLTKSKGRATSAEHGVCDC